MNNRLIAALLMSAATVTLGPVACDVAGADAAVSTPGTAIGIRKDWMDTAAKPGDD